MSRADAIDRLCPVCGAFAGHRCRGKRGMRATFHRARYQGEIGAPAPRRPRLRPDSEVAIIEALIGDAVTEVEDYLRFCVERTVSVCQSPIERVFAAALETRNTALLGVSRVHTYMRGYSFDKPPAFDGIHVFPQTEVDGYRLDFLFVNDDGYGRVSFTVVECDGHDYHERTKQQASHDKRRDRHFTKKGWRVVRFTGSDIWADPMACVEEAIEIAEGEQ